MDEYICRYHVTRQNVQGSYLAVSRLESEAIKVKVIYCCSDRGEDSGGSLGLSGLRSSGNPWIGIGMLY